MTPERWQQVKGVLTRASALQAAARALYLAEVCAEDAELRSEVESLLAAHSKEDAILDRPVDEYLPAYEPGSTEDAWLGQRIGAYEVVACIGSGGMGTVYRARRVDAQYEKEVAIKLVRAGFGTEIVLHRLRIERQILANLDHPNIARLLDGGVTSTGEPFLVLELVNGEPIDEYCDRHAPPIAERLRLFREVCVAVSYAHRHLVVHRDLKPANIFVTQEGSIKLLDFGIAKLLQPVTEQGDAVEATRTLLKAMTPAFCSPEQLLGLPVTTASDVYSLGVVLFHLLAGRSPYRSTLDSTQDAIRHICETEPMRPSVAASRYGARQIPCALPDRDLDDITLRALRKEPEKRYSSAEQFSEDVHRYLAGLPVIARGDQLSYRAGKFWRRHRIGLTMSGLAALALATGMVITIREARIAEEQRVLAAQHFASVRKLADTFIFQVHDAIKDLPGATPARNLLVSTASSYLDTLAKQAGNDRGLQRELAEAYARLGDVQDEPGAQNAGQAQAAAASYAKALMLFQTVAQSAPTDAKLLYDMANTHLNRAHVRMMLSGDPNPAESEGRQAVELLSAVVSMKPEDLQVRGALVKAYKSYARNASYAGHDEVATQARDRAIAMMEELYRQRPGDPEVAHYLSQAYRLEFNPHSQLPPDTIARYLIQAEKGLELDMHPLETDTQHELSHWDAIATDWNDLGIWRFLDGRLPGSVDAFRAAAAAMQKVTADSQNANVQLNLARIRMNLGRALVATGHLDEAEGLLQNDISLIEGMLTTTDTLDIRYLLAQGEEELGTIAEQRALAAKTPDQRLRLWTAANAWFGKSVPTFEPIVRIARLGIWDQPPVDRARAGLAHSAEEIRRLETESPP